MQRLLIASLSTLVIAATVPASAEEVTTIDRNVSFNLVEVTPFNLVLHGYQGHFKPEIPSNAAFHTAIKAKKITATDLVKSGIAAGRLPQEKLNDRSYLRAVQTQLDNLDRN